MKIYCYCAPRTHQHEQINLMVEGLKRHNITPTIKPYFDPRDVPDLAITWAHKRDGLIRTMKLHNKPYLVMERGYVGDRFHWTSCGFNGLNGRADFKNKDITDLTRWNRHFEHLYEKLLYDTESNKVLVVGQVLTDAAVAHVDINAWYSNTIGKLNEMGYDVVFRPHPLNRSPWNNKNLKYTIDNNRDIIETLKNNSFKFVVTFSSNSGVLSILHGVPTMSMDEGSMVYDITSHDLDNIYHPSEESLNQWKAKIAYTQWSPEEIKNGGFYEHLFKELT